MNLTIFQYAKSNPWVGLKLDNAVMSRQFMSIAVKNMGVVKFSGSAVTTRINDTAYLIRFKLHNC